MPAALDRINKIYRIFSWVVGSDFNHGRHGIHGRKTWVVAWVAEGQDCPSSLAREAGKVGSVDNPVHSGGCVKYPVLFGIWSLKLRVYPPLVFGVYPLSGGGVRGTEAREIKKNLTFCVTFSKSPY